MRASELSHIWCLVMLKYTGSYLHKFIDQYYGFKVKRNTSSQLLPKNLAEILLGQWCYGLVGFL